MKYPSAATINQKARMLINLHAWIMAHQEGLLALAKDVTSGEAYEADVYFEDEIARLEHAMGKGVK